MKAAKKGMDKLNEINSIFVPGELAASANTQIEQSATRHTPFAVGVPRPPTMPQPNDKAMHNKTDVVAGRTMIGSNPGSGVPVASEEEGQRYAEVIQFFFCSKAFPAVHIMYDMLKCVRRDIAENDFCYVLVPFGGPVTSNLRHDSVASMRIQPEMMMPPPT